MYNEFIIERFNKFLRDELSAAIGYKLIASKIKGLGTDKIIEELEEHAQEEFEHFNELIDYATNHGFCKDLKITLDYEVIDYMPQDISETVDFVQNLEMEARNDYRDMVKYGRENQDIELEEFFRELMQDETEHFNDLNYILGDFIPLGENKNNKEILKKIIEKVK